MKLTNRRTEYFLIGFFCLILLFSDACKSIAIQGRQENRKVPESFNSVKDTVNTAKVNWKDYFKDPNLTLLIDSALINNQDLNIVLQEIQIAKNEVRARHGSYLPFLNLGAGAGTEKVGRYTSQGASDATNKIINDQSFPDPLSDLYLGAFLSWELDIWKKLRNAKKSALLNYLSTIEGKNFRVTMLVCEIANAYYELMALDNQLEVLKKNIEIQKNALEIVKLQKAAAKVTELAVRKFEAEVYKNQSTQYILSQKITEMENKINFLVGRFPQPVQRSSSSFVNLPLDTLHAGLPSQLLSNRTDIKQAELALEAAKLDVKVAKAEFYPSFQIVAGAGFRSFSPQYLIQSPQSLMYNIAGDLMAPLINRNAIKANFYTANAKQIQAAFQYEQAILLAYTEVANQLSNIQNLKMSYSLKDQQVEALTQSIDISTNLFKFARADYMEVLLTQRDALDAKFDLIETKREQLKAMVNVYKALGGGWQ